MPVDFRRKKSHDLSKSCQFTILKAGAFLTLFPFQVLMCYLINPCRAFHWWHKQEMAYVFHCLIEQIRKFVFPAGTARMSCFMISADKLVPHNAGNKVEMGCTCGDSWKNWKEAACVLPLPHGTDVGRSILCTRLDPKELKDPRPKISSSVGSLCSQCHLLLWVHWEGQGEVPAFHLCVTSFPYDCWEGRKAPAAPAGITMGGFPIPSYRACKLNAL